MLLESIGFRRQPTDYLCPNPNACDISPLRASPIFPGLLDVGPATSIVVVTAVDFFPYDGEVGLRCVQRTGFPRKTDGRYFNFRLKLACGSSPNEPEMLRRVLILHGLPG